MKKTMLTTFLLAVAFIVLIGSCVSSADKYYEAKPEATVKVEEGDFYTFYYRFYVYSMVNGKAPDYTWTSGAAVADNGPNGFASTGSSGLEFWKDLIDQLSDSGSRGRGSKTKSPPPTFEGFPDKLYYYGDRPRGVPEHNTCEEDIDSAIMAYEEALRIDPTGTYGGNKGAVQIRLEYAKKNKQQWLEIEKPKAEQRLAAERQRQQQQQLAQLAQQAEQQRLAQERANRSVTQDMFEVVQLANNTIKITKYIGDVENVVIPSTLYGLRVTIIGEKSFFNNSIIKSVVIPDTVTEIGEMAFWFGDPYNSTSLSKVTIGKGVRIIKKGAFSLQRKLTEITIPDSITVIENIAFDRCGLTSVTFGRGLQEIGNEAFADNYLTSVTLPVSLKFVGLQAFDDNIIQTVVIPHNNISVFQAQYGIFNDNPITRITLPANISDDNMRGWGFESGLRNFYANHGRVAGTYFKDGPIWKKQ